MIVRAINNLVVVNGISNIIVNVINNNAYLSYMKRI